MIPKEIKDAIRAAVEALREIEDLPDEAKDLIDRLEGEADLDAVIALLDALSEIELPDKAMAIVGDVVAEIIGLLDALGYDYGEAESSFECECVDCGYKTSSDEHCADMECPKCGGTMRRVDRPGTGMQEGEVGSYFVAPVHNFPLADEGTSWSFSAEDGNAIIDKGGWSLYKQAHLVTDISEEKTPENKSAYTYPVAKLIGGELKYVFSAASTVYAGLRGGAREADLPDAVKRACLDTIKGIYKKFDRDVEDMTLEAEPTVEQVDMKVSDAKISESVSLREAVDGSGGMKWLVDIIEAGISGNKRYYAPEMLRESVSMFEGLRNFVDHPTKTEEIDRPERSLRDLAGWFEDVKWNPEGGPNGKGAIEGVYHVLKNGPLAGLVEEAYERGRPDLIGISIYGTGKQSVGRVNGKLVNVVEKFTDLYSADSVVRAGAGGRVRDLAASDRYKGELEMLEDMTIEELRAVRPDLVEALEEEVGEKEITLEMIKKEYPELWDEIVAFFSKKEKDEDKKEKDEDKESEPEPDSEDTVDAEEIRKRIADLERMTKESECKAVAQRVIGESSLPKAKKEQLRNKYVGKIFDEEDLKAEVKEEEDIWGEAMRSRPEIRVIESEGDKLQKRVDGMLMGEDVDGIPRFHSLHEAYCKVAGINPWNLDKAQLADQIMRESNVQLGNIREAITWTDVFGTSMNRALVKEYNTPGYDEWRDVVSDITDLSDLKQQDRQRVGYYSTIPIVSAGGTYQETDSPDEEEATYTPAKRGRLESWTWEDAINDDLNVLRKIPTRLALAAKITLYQFVFDILANGHTTATTYDGENLFDDVHNNRGTVDLDVDNLTAARVAMRQQAALSSSDTILQVIPQKLIVPTALEATALQLINSQTDPDAGASGIANPHYQQYDPIVVDYFTDDNRWFVAADPNLVPTIEIGFLNGQEEPEMFTQREDTGSAFTADKIAFKIRFVFGGTPLDHRGLYASDPNWT